MILTLAEPTPERVSSVTAWTLTVYVPRAPLPYSWVTLGPVVSTMGEPSPKSHLYFTIALPRADAALTAKSTRLPRTLWVIATETLSATKSCRRPRADWRFKAARFGLRP